MQRLQQKEMLTTLCSDDEGEQRERMAHAKQFSRVVEIVPFVNVHTPTEPSAKSPKALLALEGRNAYIWDQTLPLPDILQPSSASAAKINFSLTYDDKTSVTHGIAQIRSTDGWDNSRLYSLLSHPIGTTFRLRVPSENMVVTTISMARTYRLRTPLNCMAMDHLYDTLMQTILNDQESRPRFGPQRIAEKQNPPRSILMIGYQLISTTATQQQEEKEVATDVAGFRIVPGVPLTATNCDVALPRFFKQDRLATEKARLYKREQRKHDLKMAAESFEQTQQKYDAKLRHDLAIQQEERHRKRKRRQENPLQYMIDHPEDEEMGTRQRDEEADSDAEREDVERRIRMIREFRHKEQQSMLAKIEAEETQTSSSSDGDEEKEPYWRLKKRREVVMESGSLHPMTAAVASV